MDLRSISLSTAPPWAPRGIILEQTDPGFTLGSTYDFYGIVVDCAPATPKPYALTVDDTGHFKLLDLAKVRRA